MDALEAQTPLALDQLVGVPHSPDTEVPIMTNAILESREDVMMGDPDCNRTLHDRLAGAVASI